MRRPCAARWDEMVPVRKAAMPERTAIEWDKEDIDALGLMKVDVLGLGMLSCVSRALAMIGEAYGRPMQVQDIPAEDPAVYDMICKADTVGVFQIESRAQMSMLPRLKPRCFYDLVIEVAIVRPGPIQGDMVHPYLRRREGREAVNYPSEALRAVLGKTLGVPLFQEQAMKIAIVAAGFTPAQADRLRRSMAAFRRAGTIQEMGEKLVAGMIANGYEPDFAERCFRQLEGFGEYGFPESHAASFALIVYVSCWLKRHYPDVFLAAMLNAQPLGFYAPAQLVRDARQHGVVVRAPDVNASHWDSTLEALASGEAARTTPEGGAQRAVRLGLRQIKGLAQSAAARVIAAREHGPFVSLEDAARRAGLGFIGRNTHLITLGKGSWVFLAEVLSSLRLKPDEPVSFNCGACTACLEACPTGALPEPFVLDSRRCISYWTIEHKGEIPEEKQALIDDWLFGCDICQEVCPFNHKPELTGEESFREGVITSSRIPLDEILEIDEYSERVYGQTY